MAYLIFNSLSGRELGRRPLNRAMVIGRSSECDVCVHDILLSRRHCQFEQEGCEWVLVDLASKNGTYLGDVEIGRLVLTDGAAVRIGKTTITFCDGKFEKPARGGAALKTPNKSRPRPANPYAAMHDTVSGFDYVNSLAQRQKAIIGARQRVDGNAPVMCDVSRFPTPQPSPRDPKSYQADDVYLLLTELASSSWDSIYMNASRPAPTRPAPRPMVLNDCHPRNHASTIVDLSLQATPSLLGNMIQTPRQRTNRTRLHRAFHGLARGFRTVGHSLVLLGVAHVLTHL